MLYEGARNWPYQVIDVSIFNASDAALRPPGFDPALEAGLSYLKANCLTCHKVNGFGGEKVEGNLALAARELTAGRQMDARTVCDKNRHNHARPIGGFTEAERRAIAQSIYEYPSRVPVAPKP